MRATYRWWPLAVLALAAACAAAPPSREWILPATPEAESCASDCAETRTLCVRRPTREDVVPSRTPTNEPALFLGFDDDALRQQRCDDVYEDCVGLCPGAVPR